MSYQVSTYANGSGLWRANVLFNRPKSQTDPRGDFNTYSALNYARRLARNAIIENIAEREQKTGETWGNAYKRISRSLEPLKIIEWNSGASNNLDYGVTLGE